MLDNTPDRCYHNKHRHLIGISGMVKRRFLMKQYQFIFYSSSLGFTPKEYRQTMYINAENSTEARKKFLEYLKIENINDKRLDYVNFFEIKEDPDITPKQ